MNDLSNIKKFIDFLAEAVIIVDQDSNIICSNPSCTELLGYSEQELSKNKVGLLFESDRRAHHDELLKAFVTSASEPKRMMARGLLNCIKADKRLFPVRISISVIDIGGENYGLGIIQDQTTIVRQISLMESQSITDPLTMLYNRRYFERLLLPDNRWVKAHPVIGILYIDLDGFKAINDQFGHDSGDTVLKTVAIRLKETFRSDDLLIRLGGDEFLVAIELNDKADHKQTITLMAQKVWENLGRPISIQEKSISIGASIGAGIFPDDFADIEVLTKLADRAMYLSKKHKHKITFVADILAEPSPVNPE